MTEKIKNEHGASFAIALVFLMLCTTAGIVVLSAASASAGKTAALKKDKQAEYTISSAARLFAEELKETSYITRRKKVGESLLDREDPALTEPEGDLGALLMEAANYVEDHNSAYRLADLIVDAPKIGANSLSQMGEVKATFEMREDYSIKVTLEHEKQKYIVEVDAVSYIRDQETTEPDLGGNRSSVTYQVRSIRWGESRIKKNGG